MTNIKIHFKLLSIIFCLICPALIGQSDTKNFFKTGGDIFIAPADFEKNDWIKLSLTSAATAGAFFLDKPVKRFFLSSQNPAADFIFGIDKYYIEGTIGVVAGIYAYGSIGNYTEIRHLGLRLAEASFYASSINILIKILSGRTRPNCNCGNTNFDPFTIDIFGSSLPSAHSTLAFAFSTVMADYKDNAAWKAAWFSFSSVIALARIYHNMHWFSDVILGAAIGYFVGEFVNNHYTNKKTAGPAGNIIPPLKMLSFKIIL